MASNTSMTEDQAIEAAIEYIDQNLGTAVVYEEAVFAFIEEFLKDNYTVKFIDPTYESITSKK